MSTLQARRIGAATLTFACALRPTSARAQDEAIEPPAAPVAEPAPLPEPALPPRDCATQNPNRTVGGHQFIYPQIVDSAFVATYLGLRLRLASSEIPNLPTPFGPKNLIALGFSEGLDVGIKIADAFGIFATVGGESLLATNIPALVYQGATFDYGGNVGAILRVLKSDDSGTQLSIRGTARHTRGQVASLAGAFPTSGAPLALADLVNRGVGQAIDTPTRTLGFDGGVAVAQGFGPLFGLQGAATLGWTQATIEPYDLATGGRREVSSDGLSFRLGVAASVDFLKLGFPGAVMLEYALARETSASTVLDSVERDTTSTLFGGLYYSGRPDLQLGVGGGALLGQGRAEVPEGSSGRPRMFFWQLILRYVW